MKTIDQLRDFFNNELRSEILAVENKRKGIVTRIILAGVLILLAAIGGAYALYRLMPFYQSVFAAVWIFVMGVLGWIAFKEIKDNKDFYNDFKFQVIERIVKFVDPSFVYISHKHIQPAQLVESRLFRHLPKKYKGDDYVSGTIGGGSKIEFSEVVARNKKHDAEGHATNEWEQTFKGLFFVAQVEKSFGGQTYVVPAGDGIDTLMQTKQQAPTQMTTGDGNFDNLFSVFTTNAAEAKTLLSDEVRQRLVEFRSHRANPVRFSFIGNKINVAVWHDKDLFEPEVFKTLLDFGIIEEYYDDLYQAISIVERIDQGSKKAA